jgi:GntR family transcriptional repressor for pyruvate dehydrogenase complex
METVSSIMSPVLRQSLADDLARRIRELILGRRHGPGDRLPAIAIMAREFSVGAPTVREALKKLETLGVVEIRHGSGVYVGRDPDALLVSNPVQRGTVSKKLLVDLIEARIPIETTSARLAATNATVDHCATMHELLDQAGRNPHDAAILNQSNLGFHHQIAIASGNAVIRQMLDVLTNVFREEQRIILDIHGTRESDHREHREILGTIEQGDAERASSCMYAHLEGVRMRLLAWDPVESPLS